MARKRHLLGIAQDISTSLSRLAGEIDSDSWAEVGRLLELARQHSQSLLLSLTGPAVRLNLAQLVLDTYDGLRAVVPGHVTLRIGPLDRSVFAKCDRQLFVGVLRALIDSAVLRLGELPGWIHVEISRSGDLAILRVTDCGSGVSQGLRWLEDVAVSHGGAFLREDEPGVGTSCQFLLAQCL